MKIRYCFTLLLGLMFLGQSIYCQDYNSLSVRLNYPIKYAQEKPDRIIGGEVRLSHAFPLNRNLFFETGAGLDIWGRVAKQLKVYYYDKRNSLRSDKLDQTYFRVGLQIPLLINWKMKSWTVKSGICLQRNFFIQENNANKELDPKLNPDHPYPKVYKQESEPYNIDYETVASYLVSKKVSVFAGYKTSLLYIFDGKTYGLVNLGIDYRLNKR